MSKNEIVPLDQAGTLAIPEDMRALLKEQAKEQASKERPSVSQLSLRAGLLSLNGEIVKGNKLHCVIVLHSYLNTFYSGKFDENKIVNPDCFAVAMNEEELKPHADVKNPCHTQCDGCAKQKWGSDPGGGRGKACHESRRLLIMPADAIESVEAVRQAEVAMVKLPVTSVKQWANFINSLSAGFGLPYYAVLVELSTEPDIKTQFKVKFSPIGVIPDVNILQAIMEKRDSLHDLALLPFGALDDESEQETSAAQDEIKPGKKAKF